MSKAHDDLHRLIDALPERHALLAKRLLEVLLDEAPEDTEPLSPEERAALNTGQEQVAREETIKWKALKEELERDL